MALGKSGKPVGRWRIVVWNVERDIPQYTSVAHGNVLSTIVAARESGDDLRVSCFVPRKMVGILLTFCVLNAFSPSKLFRSNRKFVD
jgi:hypothetical protein